jgi:hypothetical protein
MKTQSHHKKPKSRGGTNDPENLIDLSLLDHGYEHARLFISGGIAFDFRNPFWKVLQTEDPELADLVLDEHRRRVKVLGDEWGPKNRDSGHMFRVQLLSDHSAAGKKGVRNQPREAKVLGGKLGGVKGGPKGSRNTNSQKWECTVTGFVSTPGPLSRYQKARGIDPSNRIQII